MDTVKSLKVTRMWTLLLIPALAVRTLPNLNNTQVSAFCCHAATICFSSVTGVLAAGTFHWMCKHGVNYGFHAIPKCEGRNDAFTVLLTRIPKERLPLIEVYDFSCQLQE